MYDNEARTNQVEGFDPVTDNQRQLARLQCCAHASNHQEASELMKMLGIFPGEEDEGLLTKPDTDFNRGVKTAPTVKTVLVRHPQSRAPSRKMPR